LKQQKELICVAGVPAFDK